MRRRVEYGDKYEKRRSTPTDAKTPPPPPPGLAVELPYEAAIAISGRKLISLNLKMTQYLNPDAAKAKNITPSRTDVEMAQELQVRIKGQVGRKISVNIDFDDTVADKRDISVVYKGDPDEVIQEAAFGDITVSLPHTEFTGYSRQLFGAKVDTKYRNMRFIAFGSRTKGLSESRRFTGNTQMERKEISDISYIRFKYYKLVFEGDTIKRGSEKIFLDDRNPNNNNINTSSMTVESLIPGTTPYLGHFDLLIPGQDYSVDYESGVIFFRKSILTNYVIAVDYQREDGSFLSDSGTLKVPKIIKDETNTFTTELKNYYSIGRNKIIRDNGRGNFILKIQDLNRDDVTTIAGRPAPKYPQDIVVDFEQGYFYFKSTAPFLPDAYKPTPVSSYRIFLEYRYRFKTFQLRPGVVPQSERVVMDGKLLTRDSDYFIDYDSGFITFYNEDRITENTVIEITYDYSPFGIAPGSIIVGLRGEVALTPKIFVGSSFISEFATQTQILPDIKSPPSSLSLWEVDSRISDIKIPLLGWGLSVSGEIAQSKRDPNIAGRAIIESMEGIKQEDNLSTFKDSWKFASAPYRYFFTRDINWANEEVLLKEINPSIDPSVTEKRQVLTINYDLTSSSQVAICQNISKIGVDFSKKLYLESWIFGDNSGSKLYFDVGSLDEDLDGDRVLDTEDKNGDGLLNQNEDEGIKLTNPDGSEVTIGAGNGSLDTEDLDTNGVLSQIDNLATPSPYKVDINWTGWKFLRIPLNITDETHWQTIKQLRLRIEGNRKGQLKIAQISFVGNRWECGFATPGSTITVSAKNNEEDPDYVSLINHPEYQSLYDIRDVTTKYRKEQALSLRYSIVSGTVSTRLLYARPYDFSQYKKLRFFLYGDGKGGLFFLQAGNETNYFEFSIPVNWTGWRVITIEQPDINRDGKPDLWEPSELNSKTKVVGQPNLNNISQIKAGICSDTSIEGEIWLNEIYAQDTYKREGLAYRANADLNIPDWASLGVRKKEVNRNFETFTGGLTNQDRIEESVYFNMPQFWLFKPSFLRWISMPLNTSFSKSLTITPSAIETRGDVVSVLEEGKVLNLSGSADTSISIKYLPGVSARYSRSITDTTQIKRLEDKQDISASASYTPPRFVLFPTSISGGYSIGYSYYRPYRQVEKLDEYFKITDYLSLQESNSYNIQTPFQFWGILSINPNYSQGNVSEEKKDLLLRDGVSKRYLKSQNQSVGVTGSLRIIKFFHPSFSYNIRVDENYNLHYSTPHTYPGETKAITRTGSGEVSWNFNFRDITDFPHTMSLGINTSFRITDGDSYENVPGTYSVRDKLWLREELPGLTEKRRSATQSDTIRFSGRWSPLEQIDFQERLSPLKTLNSNFTYSRSDEFSAITGTQRRSYTLNWPDLLFSLSDVEKMIFLERWTADTTINYKTATRRSETIGQASSESSNYGIDGRTSLFKKYNIGFNYGETYSEDVDLRLKRKTKVSRSHNYGAQTGFNLGKWRITLKYDTSKSQGWDGFGKLISDSETRSPTISAHWDYASPTGIKIPLIGKTLPLTNRLTFSSNFNLTQNRSVINYERGNTDVYNLNFTADYEASPNFRVAVGGGAGLYRNLVQSHEDNYSININSRLTIQF